jgi:hypothetical protein
MPRPSFPLFSLLPLELRQQIWNHALPPQSQIYELSMYAANMYAPLDIHADDYDALDDDVFLGDLWNILYLPKRALPAVLQTCQEARELGRRYYIAHEKGPEMFDSTVISRIEGQIYWHRKDPDENTPAPFHHEIELPHTRKQTGRILCAKTDLVHFLPFDARLRSRRDTSTRIINCSKLSQRFAGIKYLAISLPDLDAWLWQCPKSDIFFSAVDVLFVLGNEKDGMENYGINWSRCKELPKYGREATLEQPIAARKTMFVDSLEAAMVEIQSIIAAKEATSAAE